MLRAQRLALIGRAEGLAGGKTVIVASSRGGAYGEDSAFDHQESYLKTVFGFFGVTDVRKYNVDTNTWTPLAPAPIEPRHGHTAVFLQNRMVVWGGASLSGAALGDGAAYDLASDTWAPIAPSPLSGRGAHRAVWTGREMLVWGGFDTAVQADGAEITTIEGLADGDKLHPLQEGFWEEHGLQCGYCTPGMIMQATDLLRENPSPDEAYVRQHMEGNLCRCTGYHNIVKAVLQAAGATRTGGEQA